MKIVQFYWTILTRALANRRSNT